MRSLRFYCPSVTPGSVRLDSTESHHFIHVLRGKPGMEIEVFDGKGSSAIAQVSQVTKKEVVVEVKQVRHAPALKPAIILAVSLPKGGRFDLAVEKCTELGVDHLCAVQFERTVKMGKQDAMERYNRLAVSAAKQSGRNFLPLLSGPLPLEKTIFDLKNLYPSAFWIFGGFGSDAASFSQITTSHVHNKEIICLVGPEGGFTDEETAIIKSVGCREIKINPHILRTETAALAFAALLGTLKL